MDATLFWPIKVLPSQNVTFEIMPRTLAGPASVSGGSQVMASDAGLWRATYTNVMVKS